MLTFKMASVPLPLVLPFFSAALLSISIFKAKRRIKTTSDPLVLDRSVSEEMARARRDELRILEVRIEALKSLVERLRYSHSQGLINDEEFEALSKKHAEEIRQLDRELIGKRLVVELFELEEIRERMAGAFAEKISELNETIMAIRRKLGFDQAVSRKMIDVQILPMQATEVHEKVQSPAEVITPLESRVRKPTDISVIKEQPTKRASSVEEKPNEHGVEDELSRIREDVENLLQELEQMERNRD
jgi:hypothetical protein